MVVHLYDHVTYTVQVQQEKSRTIQTRGKRWNLQIIKKWMKQGLLDLTNNECYKNPATEIFTFGGWIHRTLVNSLYKSLSFGVLVAFKPSASCFNGTGWKKNAMANSTMICWHGIKDKICNDEEHRTIIPHHSVWTVKKS